MNSKETAYECASKYLANRMHTETEVRDKLISKGFKQTEVDNTIDELKMLRYIDDYQYSLSFIEYSIGKNRGSLRIKSELLEKGVIEQIVDETLDEYKEENLINELDLAMEYAKSMCNNCSGIDEKLVAKVSRSLSNKGFNTDTIYKVVGEIYKWRDLREQD